MLTLSRTGNAPNGYRLRFADQVAVDVLIDSTSLIELPTSTDVPQSTCDHFLTDQVLPRMLAHEGRLVLHAGAVRLGQGGIVLMGKSGGGKSTLTASFDRAGHALLGDDAIIVSWPTDSPCAQAVYPSLRLFPDSVDALYVDNVITTSVAHYTPKQRISVPVSGEDAGPILPIRAIFLIADPSEEMIIQSRRLSIAEACMAFIENSFALDPTDMQRSRNRLEAASALARHVPTFEISYPRDYARLPEVRMAILSHVPDVDPSTPPAQGQ